ncbi:MAG: ATP-binding cassette domain-containing protein, partial [Chloroflexota bacterium]|nr:ATP-binding cassette domain-containing protein [Chloroflexota bacterium]
VRAHTAEPYESARWLAWIKADWQIKARTVTFHNLVRTLPMDLIQHFGVGLVYGFGAYEVISGRLSIGGLVAFIIYVPRAYVALETILDGYIATGQAKAAAERIDSLLGLPREVDQTVHASTGSARTDASAPAAARNEAGRLGAAIEFSNVSFDYGREGFGLEDVSFQIEPGAFVGVVGPSGGGKSTIIDLLLRFYEPRSGEIRVDGKDIESLPLSHLRQMIGLVPQDVFLWNDSIYANLVYPSRRVPREQLIAAAKAAQFHGFVESLPEGYETPVGERGLALSGGERQRLSLCRAILEEPHILLLDEATSALDSLIEREIRAALERARQGRTTLVVAHRLVTVMKADKILVLDEGRLVQEGTPQELLAQPGLFQDLYEAQRL